MIEQGVNSLDLIPSNPLEQKSFLVGIALLEQNFGTEYSKEKMTMLFDMMREENWSDARFERTLKWFLKTKYNQAWTISDWFQYGIKLYPQEWYNQKVSAEGVENSSLECYKLPNDVYGYKYIDGEILPFPRKICGTKTDFQ